MRKWIILWNIICLPVWAVAQVCGLEDTLYINPNSTHIFTIQIADVVNDDLADPDQGICGVEIEFVHQFSKKMELWITSPDGTTVQLIGPNAPGANAFTFFARWDISFVPCADAAVPDLGYAAQWNNNQVLNFVSGGQYTGSYYPFMGCLEDFNSGPVNGEWTITVVNDPSEFYGGAIVDFRLIFCDDRGIDCCFADAGFFTPVPNETLCQGAQALNFSLLPAYIGRRPDSLQYGYLYAIATDGVLTHLDTLADLRAFPPGNYEICGLAYERADTNSLPVPDGVLLLDSLRSDLASFYPSFCGELTPACATVTIFALPDTTFLNETICYADTFFVGSTAYFSNGVFVETLQGLGGCDSIVQLELAVRPLPFTPLAQTICAGDSVVVGNTAYVNSGFYRDTLVAATDCDSIVELSLTVLQPILVTVDTAICAGDSVSVGAFRYGTSGVYVVELPSAQGCDSIVTLQLDVFTSQAIIAAPDTITCFQPQITLNGAASFPAGQLRYIWQNAAGDSIGTGPSLSVGMPGLYVLEVRPLAGTPQCRERDSVVVIEDRIFPIADAGADALLNCAQTTATLGGPLTSQGARYTQLWTTNTGNFLAPTDQAFVQINGAGRYILTATDLINGCTARDTAFVSIDTLHPQALAGPDQILNCDFPTRTLDGSNSSPGLNYNWTGPCISGNSAQAAVEVTCAGVYILMVSNPVNFCVASDTVTVSWDTLPPMVDAGLPQTITCQAPEVTLTGNASSAGNNFIVAWSGPGITSGANTLSPTADVPGLYVLIATDLNNGCRDTSSVTVGIDTLPPISDAGPDRRLDCSVSEVTLGGAATSIGPSITYTWFTADGRLTGPSDTPTTTTDSAAVYVLIVFNTATGCSDTSNMVVTRNVAPPLADAGDSYLIDCQIREVMLNGAASASGPLITYSWDGPCVLGPSDTAVAMAECPGLYTLTVTNLDNGCVNSDTVSVLLADETAIAVLPDTVYISCQTGTALIDGSASVYGVFEWLLDGMPVNILDLTPAVNTPGIYTLLVNTISLNCPDADTTVVLLSCAVEALIAPADTLSCTRSTVTLNASASSAGPGITYAWTGPASGCIAAGQGTTQPQVVCAGVYTLVVTNTLANVTDTAFITVTADQSLPVAEAGITDTITCSKPFGILNGSASSTGPQYTYAWTDAAGNTVSTRLTDTLLTAGTYFLEVLDTVNGCGAFDFVTIFELTNPPIINFGNAVFPCNRDSFLLRAFPEPPDFPYTFSWSGPGIVSGGDAAEVWIDTAGLYVLQVVNAVTGCSATASVTVIQPECGPCIAVAPPDTVTCAIAEVTLSGSFCEPCPGCLVSWSAVSGEILSGGNTLTPQVRAGAYVLSATDSLGVTTTLSVEVIAQTQPPAVNAGPDRTLNCRDTVVMLGGANPASGPQIRYAWQSLNGSAVTPPDSAFAMAILPDTYFLEVRNLTTGCFSIDTVVVGIDTLLPIAEAGPVQLITCTTPFAILDGAGSSLGNNFMYKWTASVPGAIAAGDTTLNPIANAPGTFYIEVTNTLNGCSATDSTTVTRNVDLPFIPVLPDQTLTCADSVLVISPNLPDTTGFSFQWCRIPVGGPPVDCAPGLNLSIQTPGVYRFEITDVQTGCRNTAFMNVAENKTPPLADAGMAPGVLSCTQTSLSLAGAVGPAGVPLSFVWTAVGGSPISPPDALNPVITLPDTYILHVVRSDNGCEAVDSVVILLNDNFPIADAGPDTALTCAAPELRLQGTATTIGGQVQWSWIANGGQILDGAATPTPRINQPGEYILTITDPANGCTAMDTVVVTRNQTPPDIVIDAPGGFSLNCASSTLLLDAGASVSGSGGLLRFSWSGEPGSIVGNADSATILVGGVGFYRLIAEDVANGCRDTTLVQIGADFAAPVVSISSPLPLTCTRLSANLNVSSFPNGNFLTATWRLPTGDTVVQPNGNLNFEATLAGIYQLWVTDTRNGCAGTATANVLQDTMAPSAIVAPPPALNCERRSTLLDGSASTGRGILTYRWTGPAGGILSGENAPAAVAGMAGIYTLEVSDNINGCRDTVAVEVMELSAPITGVEMDVRSPSCFEYEDGSLIATAVIGGVGPYLFALNGGSRNAVREYRELPPGHYTLAVWDVLGCTFDTTFVLIDPPLLQVDLGEDRLITLGDSVELTALTNIPVVEYNWRNIGIFPAPEGAVQTVRPTVTTTYQVTVVNENGCTANDWVTITINTQDLYYVPSAFSPNGDGINDVFMIFAGNAVQEVRSLRIFDRWGNLVFFQNRFPPNDPSFGWDGLFEGRSLNPAVFVVMAEIELKNGRVEVFTGDLALMR
jgi:gliding motility-associated-like protein